MDDRRTDDGRTHDDSSSALQKHKAELKYQAVINLPRSKYS